MTNTTMINYSTRDFATKEQLELYLLRQEKAFSPEVIKANNRWWAEISTKSSRDQLSFPYAFDDLVEYKTIPDLEELGKSCWIDNSKWLRNSHLERQNF